MRVFLFLDTSGILSAAFIVWGRVGCQQPADRRSGRWVSATTTARNKGAVSVQPDNVLMLLRAHLRRIVMFALFDSLDGFFWCVTYSLVILFHYHYHEMTIPPVAVANNLGWETAAFVLGISGFQRLSWMHIAWFALDAGVALTYVLYCKPLYARRKTAFFAYYALILFAFFILFTKTDSGMLVSSFVIDLTMALEWFMYFSTKEKLKTNYIVISLCITKLVGDICAWLAYRGISMTANVIGIAVLFLNLGCLIAALLRRRNRKSVRIR